LGLDYSETYSCYKGGEKHCGKCGTCRERIEALRAAGIEDHTEYES
jgi:7-cyano-7-deazaguanine synthase